MPESPFRPAGRSKERPNASTEEKTLRDQVQAEVELTMKNIAGGFRKQLESLADCIEDEVTSGSCAPQLEKLTLSRENATLFSREFLPRVFELCMVHQGKPFHIDEFHTWLCLPQEVTTATDPDAVEAQWSDNDLPCIKHPFVQLQLCFMKLLEGKLHSGTLPLPKPLLGGTVNFNGYREFVREHLPPLTRRAIEIVEEFKRHAHHKEDRIPKLFEYDLRETLAKQRHYKYVGRFRTYTDSPFSDDVAIAIDGFDGYYLIRRDGKTIDPSGRRTPQFKGQPSLGRNIEGYKEGVEFSEGYFRMRNTRTDWEPVFVSPNGREIGTGLGIVSAGPFRHGVAIVECHSENGSRGHNLLREDGTLVFSHSLSATIYDVSEEGIILLQKRDEQKNERFKYLKLGADPRSGVWLEPGVDAHCFEEGLALLMKEEGDHFRVNYLKTDKTLLWETWQSARSAESFKNGLARVVGTDGKIRYYLRNGGELPLPAVEGADPFIFGRAFVRTTTGYTLLSLKGESLLPAEIPLQALEYKRALPSGEMLISIRRSEPISNNRGQRQTYENILSVDGAWIFEGNEHIVWRIVDDYVVASVPARAHITTMNREFVVVRLRDKSLVLDEPQYMIDRIGSGVITSHTSSGENQIHRILDGKQINTGTITGSEESGHDSIPMPIQDGVFQSRLYNQRTGGHTGPTLHWTIYGKPIFRECRGY